VIQDQRSAAQGTCVVPVRGNLFELFPQGAVRFIPKNKPQHGKKNCRQPKSHQPHYRGGILLVKTCYHPCDREHPYEAQNCPTGPSQRSRIHVRVPPTFRALPLAPKPQRHYRDVIELISLEAPDLVRAARRVTRNAIVIAICDGPRPVRTHTFQWQTLPPRRNRYSVTIWLSGRPTLCAPMEHLSL